MIILSFFVFDDFTLHEETVVHFTVSILVGWCIGNTNKASDSFSSCQRIFPVGSENF